MTEQNCQFVPKFLASDAEKGHVYMKYCGIMPENTKANKEMRTKLLHALDEKYGVIHKNNKGEPYYDYVRKNTAILNGYFHIIDFGSPRWEIKPKPLKPQNATQPTPLLLPIKKRKIRKIN